ncbi:MAG: tetratricopeptide repeat protein [Gammaproteobacteria bacterium]|nr:tetratricopeptide repeat protein [Gammaproteobacteria bacterium]
MDRTDEEQVEALKRWWREYGTSVVAGVVLGLVALFGTKAWFDYQEGQAEAASARYERLTTLLARGDAQLAVDLGDLLIEEHAGSSYATLAALSLARHFVDAGKPEEARSRLQWAVAHAATSGLGRVARLRLARLLLDSGDYAAALETLEKVPEGSPFEALYAEARGDIHRARGDAAAAREAYRAALAATGAGAGNRFLIRLKLDDLAAAEAESPS